MAMERRAQHVDERDVAHDLISLSRAVQFHQERYPEATSCSCFGPASTIVDSFQTGRNMWEYLRKYPSTQALVSVQIFQTQSHARLI